MKVSGDFFWLKLFSLLTLLGSLAYFGYRQFMFTERFSLTLENQAKDEVSVMLSTYNPEKGNLLLQDLAFRVSPGETAQKEIALDFSFPAPCESFVVKSKAGDKKFPCGSRTEVGFHQANTEAKILFTEK